MSKPGMLRLQVRPVDGTVFLVAREVTSSIASIKQSIQEQRGIDVIMQKLICAGRLLPDDSTLELCGISERDFLVLVTAKPRPPSLMTTGAPLIDLFSYDPARFHKSTTADATWVIDRTHESYAKTYAIVFPSDEALAGRGARRSAIYDSLARRGCVYQARYAGQRAASADADADAKACIHTHAHAHAHARMHAHLPFLNHQSSVCRNGNLVTDSQ